MRGRRLSLVTLFSQASDTRQFGVKGSRLLEQTPVGCVQASAFLRRERRFQFGQPAANLEHFQMFEATDIGMFNVHYVVT